MENTTPEEKALPEEEYITEISLVSGEEPSAAVSAEVEEPVKPEKKRGFFRRNILAFIFIFLFLCAGGYGAYQTYYAFTFQNLYNDTKGKLSDEKLYAGDLLKKLEVLTADKTILEREQEELRAGIDKVNAEISAANDQLENKKNELTKAQKGVAKFGEVEVLFDDFVTKSEQYIAAFYESITFINRYLSTGGQQGYADQANAKLAEGGEILQSMGSIIEKINGIFNQIKSGNY